MLPHASKSLGLTLGKKVYRLDAEEKKSKAGWPGKKNSSAGWRGKENSTRILCPRPPQIINGPVATLEQSVM